MKMLLTGHKGQLGGALLPRLRTAGHRVQGIDLPEHDITDRADVADVCSALEPDLILNAAALTDVDGCARDPHLAYRVNGYGVQVLAQAAAEIDAEFVQISTNEVFDGAAATPYHEWAPRNPINAYGVSKRAGEFYAQSLLTRFFIVRTAWLYAVGGHNFPHRILALADERDSLQVVTDEVSSPTYVADLADALIALIGTHAYGIYHLVNEGSASRFAFAKALLDASGRGDLPVEPITSDAFERASKPPPYAPLANHAAAALDVRLRPWQEAVAAFIDDAGYHRE
jgi:dTDP-4-dehydrorhamnose reductase